MYVHRRNIRKDIYQKSKNVPLQQLDNIVSVAKNKDIPLFVYCYSGSRSRQATGDTATNGDILKVK